MNTPKHALYAFLAVFLLVLTPFVTACSETDEDTTIEWTDWAIRNEAYFRQQMATARAAIAQAQATYGDQWEAHCDWRVYKNYRLAVDDPGTAFDSICVQIINRGTAKERKCKYILSYCLNPGIMETDSPGIYISFT